VSEPDPLAGTLLRAALATGEEAAQFDADPAGTLLLAGVGDLPALRHLARRCRQLADRTEDEDARAVAYVEGMTFSRLAASQGDPLDYHLYFDLLTQYAQWQAKRGRRDLSARFEGLALNVAEALAENGDEQMADLIVKAGDVLPAEVFTEAKRQRSAH